jgi:hypothetical protein
MASQSSSTTHVSEETEKKHADISLDLEKVATGNSEIDFEDTALMRRTLCARNFPHFIGFLTMVSYLQPER